MLVIFYGFTAGNSLLVNMPESVSLLLFGVVLIALTFGLRWFTDKVVSEDSKDLENTL